MWTSVPYLSLCHRVIFPSSGPFAKQSAGTVNEVDVVSAIGTDDQELPDEPKEDYPEDYPEGPTTESIAHMPRTHSRRGAAKAPGWHR